MGKLKLIMGILAFDESHKLERRLGHASAASTSVETIVL